MVIRSQPLEVPALSANPAVFPDAFEQSLCQRQWHEAQRLLLLALDCLGGMPIFDELTLESGKLLCERWAVAISRFLTQAPGPWEPIFAVHLIVAKPHLTAIFAASSYQHMDHIFIDRCGAVPAAVDLVDGAVDDFLTFLICYTLNSQFAICHDTLFDRDSDLATFHYLALLDHVDAAKSTAAHCNIARLIEQRNVLTRASTQRPLLSAVANPWMSVSFLDHPDRHELKRAFNDYIRRIMRSCLHSDIWSLIDAQLCAPRHPDRLLLGMEQFRSDHAMYRCYRSRIAALRERFELVLVAEPDTFDADSAGMFHRVLSLGPRLADLEQNLINIAAERAPTIWYPSLGMSRWGALLANVRLAPVQVMSLGHPASSYSPEMDYLLPLGPQTDPRLMQRHCTERLPDTAFPEREYTKPPQFPGRLPNRSTSRDRVRVAINSTEMKITARFLDLLVDIQNKCRCPVEFHFFQVQRWGMFPFAFEQALSRRFQAYRYHAYAAYDRYLENLANCDLALGTFPFGGSNSNIDLLLLGIPKLVLDREGDFAERTDAAFMHRFQAPDILTATSTPQYRNRAVSLIEDRALRESVAAQLCDRSPYDHVVLGASGADRLIQYFDALRRSLP